MRFLLISITGLLLLWGCSSKTDAPTSYEDGAFRSGIEGSVDYTRAAQRNIAEHNYDSAIVNAQFALESLTQPASPALEGYLHLLLADGNYFTSNYEEAIVAANQALDFASETDSDSLSGHIHKRLGNIYNKQAEYSLASEYLYKALELAERSNNVLLLGMTYEDLGNNFDDIDNDDRAMEYYEKAITLFEESGNTVKYASVLGNIAGLLEERGETEKALLQHKESLRLLKQANHKRFIANTLSNIAVCFRELGELDSARVYLQETMKVDIQTGYRRGVAMDLELIGDLLLRSGQPDSAKIYLLKALSLSREIDSKSRYPNIYMRLFRADSTLGNFKEAIQSLQKEEAYEDSIFDIEKSRLLAEMSERYEAEKKDQEIAYLYQKASLVRTRNISIGITLLSIMIILGLIWGRQRVQQRKTLEIIEKDRVIAEQELTLTKNETEHLKQELTNYALHIVQKNEFLEQIKKEMAQVRSNVKNTEALKQINEMGGRIYQNVTLNREREEFQQHVEQVSQGFFVRLEQKKPGLTRQEKRLAALVRLNLSSKEIAGILNISPKSVDQSRYRLRKKLNLNGTSLSDYLSHV
ncbi:MAG: tetratricopeptide repeat protein [Bacteroidota bacterium]